MLNKCALCMVLCMTGLFVFSLPTWADCQYARDTYQDSEYAFRSAKFNLESSLSSFQDCVSFSDGQDDCSSELHDTQSLHNDFENEVSRLLYAEQDVQLECW